MQVAQYEMQEVNYLDATCRLQKGGNKGCRLQEAGCRKQDSGSRPQEAKCRGCRSKRYDAEVADTKKQGGELVGCMKQDLVHRFEEACMKNAEVAGSKKQDAGVAA
jgi:hypothetical protein